MSRHTFRWEGLAFGMFFLAAVGHWAVWDRDLLDTRELTLVASGLLIVLGAIGVAATVWRSRPPATIHPEPSPETITTPEGPEDEEADPKP